MELELRCGGARFPLSTSAPVASNGVKWCLLENLAAKGKLRECRSLSVLKGTERNVEWQTMIELSVCCISPSTWNECFWQFVSPKSRLRRAKTDFCRTISWKLSKNHKLDQKQRQVTIRGWKVVKIRMEIGFRCQMSNESSFVSFLLRWCLWIFYERYPGNKKAFCIAMEC